MNGKTIPEVVGSNALLVGRKEGEVNADCMVTLKTGDGIPIQCKSTLESRLDLCAGGMVSATVWMLTVSSP